MFTDPIVVLPWDFSDHAKQALKFAQQITFAANIRVVCVLEEPNPYEPGVIWGTVSEDVAQEKCEQRFDESIDKSRFPDLLFQVAFGEPADEIVRFASAQNADLILISSHGRTGIQRLLLGSVAEKVVRTATCPVLLLPDAWISRLQTTPTNGN